MQNLNQYIKNQTLLELRDLNKRIDNLIKKGKSYKHLQAEHRQLVALID